MPPGGSFLIKPRIIRIGTRPAAEPLGSVLARELGGASTRRMSGIHNFSFLQYTRSSQHHQAVWKNDRHATAFFLFARCALCGSIHDMSKPAKNTICLWYNGDAEEAARFYAKTFPDSSLDAVHRAPGDYPGGKKEDVLTVDFTVMGIPCLGLNGGSSVKHNWAFSFQVATVDQAETDRYWNAIVGNGGQENACGWCQDKWGLSWQITPVVLTKAVTDPDPGVAKRAFDAMMTMKKIDVAAIEAARRG
jgi:predicted 3-demethylubiquinone-9 3-methyltransferase (glyoxalase superfamily)